MRTLAAVMAAATAITLAPVAHADSGDQGSAEAAVKAIYGQVIPGCTMGHNHGAIQSIQWDSFYPASYGEGHIVDANSALGGPFQVTWTNPRVGAAQDSPPFRAYGQWGVNLEFC